MTAVINTGTVIDRIAVELGEELNDRQAPTWTGAIMAAAGAAIGLGAMGMSLEDSLQGGSRILPLLTALALVGVAYAVLIVLAAHRERVLPAAIALASIGLAGVSLLLLPLDTGSAALRGLIMGVVFVAAWLAPLTRGRPWLLGLGLVGFWAALLDLVQDDALDTAFGLGGPSVTTAGMVSVLFGVAMLGIMFALDKRGCHGALATPFAAVGNAAFVIGVLAVLNEITSAAGVGTVVLLAGAGLAWLGAKGRHRRMTTWLGGIGVFTGVVSYVGAIYDGDSLVIPSALLALFGVMVGAAAFFIADYLSLGDARPAAAPGGPADASHASTGDGVVDASAGSGARQLADGGPDASPEVSRGPVDDGAVGAPQEEAASGPAPGWYADPAGRHTHRWWDGTAWTDRVNDNGVDGVDPVG